MEKELFDLVVLGGGPGGYVAAIRAANKGAKVALIESKELGGTCLNRGCIPTKSLLASASLLNKLELVKEHGITIGEKSFNFSLMKERKDRIVEKLRRGVEGLMLSQSITVVKGHGRFISPNEIQVDGTDRVISAPKIIIATGSEPRALPFAKVDGDKIHDSTTLLQLTHLPKSMVIIGGGFIGCEFASLFQALGVDVTIVELMPQILPIESREIGDVLATALKKRGIKIECGVQVEELKVESGRVICRLKEGRSFDVDLVLISVGRKFNTDDIGLEKCGIVTEKNGAIAVDDYLETAVKGIYAIGDITNKWLLAHVASHQGIIAADNALGAKTRSEYNAIPSVVYTSPEIATVGLSLEKAKAAGLEAKVAKFPFMALGKAHLANETEGFAQIVVDAKSGVILGAQAVGAHAATMIAEMVVAIKEKLTVEKLSETIHAHPTTPEAWLEASFIALDMPLHVPRMKPLAK